MSQAAKTQEDLLQELVNLCQQRSFQIGFAESCTGGLMSSVLAALPGVSQFFKGSVVCYHKDVKVQVLGVPPSLIQVHGEVSLPVAQAMARGAKDLLSVDWSIAITGVAGPSGGSIEKPVGTVCFAIAGPGFELQQRQQFGETLLRQDIQRKSVFFALDFLVNAMK